MSPVLGDLNYFLRSVVRTGSRSLEFRTSDFTVGEVFCFPCVRRLRSGELAAVITGILFMRLDPFKLSLSKLL